MRNAIMIGTLAALTIAGSALARDELDYSYLELNGGLKYADFDKGGNDTSLAVGADVNTSHDLTTWMLGGSIRFRDVISSRWSL